MHLKQFHQVARLSVTIGKISNRFYDTVLYSAYVYPYTCLHGIRCTCDIQAKLIHLIYRRKYTYVKLIEQSIDVENH